MYRITPDDVLITDPDGHRRVGPYDCWRCGGHESMSYDWIRRWQAMHGGELEYLGRNGWVNQW